MNRRLIGVFAFALIVASLTSFAVYRVIIVQMRSPGRSVAANKLLVAGHDLQLGALIHDGDLKEISWGGPISDHAIKGKQDAVGRGVVATIYENEPILDGRLAAQGAGAGLASTIPVGMRAVALRVNEVVGLAGFVLPGMRVDVLVAGTVPGIDSSREGTLCRTVLQNIEVLSAGQKIDKNTEGKPESAQVVNLLVTPDQAEILDLASDQTKVQLVLRNPIDTKEQITHGASLASLFGVDPRLAMPPRMILPGMTPRLAPPAPVRHEPETTTVEVFSGVKRSEQKFDVPQGSK
jgi:pilus assembly protein CpaB